VSESISIFPDFGNLIMGDPISDQDGVCCCPALNEETGDKYIVKSLSIPASQTKLEALLLTGAFEDESSALSYFKELSDGVIEEVRILNQLSSSKCFVSYLDQRLVQMDDQTGYKVYLISPYRHCLAPRVQRLSMTHLRAFNLGLDLCAALSACRTSGYLYVDLKPENIFVTDEQRYVIGDVGFLKLDSLMYASLPDKYRSIYTAPEIKDAISALNPTLDVYAAGLILYQIYNGGKLPELEEGEALPSPLYADYEMADILLKACAPDPKDRWEDPDKLSQALISYMQRNGVNDTPIVSVTDREDAAVISDEDSFDEETLPTDDELDAFDDNLPDWGAARTDDPNSFYEDDFGNLSFIEGFSPEEADHYQDYEAFSDEVTEMLAQADELAAHPVPEPAVAPEPIAITIPEFFEPEEVPDSSEESDQNTNDVDPDITPAKKKRVKGWLLILLAVLLAGVLAFGGYYYYTNYYLQHVDSITLDGHEDGLTVYISSDIDESKLSVVCDDRYGNRLTVSVKDKKAVFTNLVPNTSYTIRIEIDGLHKLTGQSSANYTTPMHTSIIQFNAKAGFEDGSAIVGFTIDGPKSSQWRIVYFTEGEDERSVTFSSEMVTLSGLTVGNEYTFRLEAVDDLFVTGTNEIKFTAQELIYAQNLRAVSFIDGILTIRWDTPDGTVADNWTVICSDSAGQSHTVVTSGTTAVFENLDPADSYKIEVICGGMSVSQTITVLANSISLTDFQAAINEQQALVLQWNASIPNPEDGWILQYQIMGTDVRQTLICTENTALIPTPIPGYTYQFTLQTSTGSTLLSDVLSFDVPAADDFSGTFGGLPVTRDDLTFSMCKTPAKTNWTRNDLSDSDYKTEFAPNEKASFLVKLDASYGAADAEIKVVYIVFDVNENPLLTSTQDMNWQTMWSKKYCELDIPVLPEAAGNYSVCVYFNGGLVAVQEFTVAE